MRRRLSTVAKEYKDVCGATVAHLGRLQDLDGARNPEQCLHHVTEVQAALRLIGREMDLLAKRCRAQLARRQAAQ